MLLCSAELRWVASALHNIRNRFARETEQQRGLFGSALSWPRNRWEPQGGGLLLHGEELRWVASALHSVGRRLAAAARALTSSASSSGPPAQSLAAGCCARAAAPLQAAWRAALAAALDARAAGDEAQVCNLKLLGPSQRMAVDPQHAAE